MRLTQERVELLLGGRTVFAPIDGSSPLRVNRGMFWSELALAQHGSEALCVDGVPNDRAQALEDGIAAVLSEQRKRVRREMFIKAHAQIGAWLEDIFSQLKSAQDQRRWFTHEQQHALLRSRPALSVDEEELWELSRDPDVRSAAPDTAERIEERLRYWKCNWLVRFAQINEQHINQELVARKDLFDRVESMPLTEEQARAVICFDNRVQVVASAGSGKTSTMVAKAAYAIHCGLLPPERIVLLAFNKNAAEELQERTERAFARLGMEGVTVTARTFHAIGLTIVGKATGQKPDVPEWAIDAGGGLRKLSEIVDRLRDVSSEFRTRWDLFRLVFGKDLPPFGGETPAEMWDKDGNGYVRTLRGELVRSFEERTPSSLLLLPIDMGCLTHPVLLN